jgi:hypothetical protein
VRYAPQYILNDILFKHIVRIIVSSHTTPHRTGIFGIGSNTNFKSHDEVNVSEEINDYSKYGVIQRAPSRVREPRQNKLENTVEQQI